jgi:CBS domain-containing protein
MEKISGLGSYMPFSRLIDKSKHLNAVIRKFEQDLRSYGDLRNAIVHHRTDNEYTIAEPHDDIVELIEYIDRELSKPVTVGDMFLRKVHTLQAYDTLATGLKLIREKKFNQIPIYQNKKFIGLVTATGITYWLADNMTDKMISREMPALLDIYSHEKQKNAYRFVERDLSVYEAEEYFEKSVGGGKRLEALLITENGRLKRNCLGSLRS